MGTRNSGWCRCTFLKAFLLSLIILPAQAQWLQQNSGTTATLWSVHFEHNLTGWAVFNNTVLKTTNGGSTWQASSACSACTMTGIYFVGSDSGWAVGASDSGSAIWRTSDGGDTWIRNDPHIGSFMSGVFFANTKVGWAFGQSGFYNGKILKTTNGGVIWMEQNVSSNGYLLSGYFVDSLDGWAVGYHSLFRTTNGGEIWEEQDTAFTHPSALPISSIWFVDKENGWYVGGISEVTVIARTTNAGKDWTHQVFDPPPPSFFVSRLNWVQFVNPSKGWAVGRRYFSPRAFIAATSDGGDTWHEQDVGNSSSIQQLESVCFVDSLHGWAVGENGTTLATTNGGLTFVSKSPELPSAFLLKQNYPNPFNSTTNFVFDIPTAGNVTLKVFDVLGREIAALVNEKREAGAHEVTWDAGGLSSGVYCYRLQAGGFTNVRKMVVLK